MNCQFKEVTILFFLQDFCYICSEDGGVFSRSDVMAHFKMTRNLKILTSIWFLLGLTILLLNDFVLKGLYGNWLTGKLSDFAGLFIFPLFWTTLLPRHKNKIFWLTGLQFIFWKSPLSQVFIDAWNDMGILNLQRTVDFTDLLALTILPIAYTLEKNKDNLKFIRLSPTIPIAISAFAFMATSKGGPQPEVNYFLYYHIQENQQTIIKRLEDAGQEKCIDSDNKNLPPYKFCRLFIKNDTVKFIDIDVYETKSGQTAIQLNTIKYDEVIFNQKDGDNLDSTKKELLKNIFEREVLNKMIKNAP